MNADRVMAHFEKISDAPDAVDRLRRFVFDLAVRGKLVEQDPKEGTAAEWLGDRAAEAEGRDEPFPLQPGWAWTTLKLIGESFGGGTPSKTNAAYWAGEIPWVTPKDMKVTEIADAQDHISQSGVENSSARLIPAGAVLMVVRGMILAHSFPTALNKRPVTINQDMKAVVPFAPGMSRFLLLLTQGMKPTVLSLVKHSTHGTCKLLTDELFSLLLPVPPLAEQHRIVAKVDEVMQLCDQLEASQAERESRRDRLVVASLNRLSQPTDPDEFKKDAGFHLRNLNRLSAKPEHIKELRKAILNLAVRGKLVPQDEREGTAEELLVRIDEEKSRLTKAKKIGRRKPVPRPTVGEGGFSVPANWQWCRVEHVIYTAGDGPHFSPQYVDADRGVPFLSTRNISTGGFQLDDLKYVSREDHEDFVKKIRADRGDILYTKGGTTGIAVVNDLPFDFSVWVHVAILKVPLDYINSRFLALALNSPHCYEQSQRLTHGIGNRDLGLTRMILITIPLPPLAEQKRIVAKVDELMAICDQLEKQLDSQQKESRRLLEALLHEALEGVGEEKHVASA